MRRADVPAVDDRAVVPESGTEMLRGEVRKVLPAEPPHAERQCDIAYVIRADLTSGYVASTELLTRVDHESDFAADACIRKAGRDPETGSRYLEELAFEVKHKQSHADLRARARKLSRRGVRRIFAIHVQEEAGLIKAGPVTEWLASEDRWLELHPDAEIADPCLAQPLKLGQPRRITLKSRYHGNLTISRCPAAAHDVPVSVGFQVGHPLVLPGGQVGADPAVAAGAPAYMVP